ncbi:hypothetical protein [Govanella unica]|uniref:Uncharacterized protein n=1 Tax=Govanella unica TaxID=2975056 RepID=A0A9X3TX39_9PROT|nr:hypothetical protein [Govania unica]MDA5192997.1 hypothetical protein [Govania unica]
MKSVARLSASLLARKGHAVPAQESATFALAHNLPGDPTPSAPPVSSFSATYARPAPRPVATVIPEPRAAKPEKDSAQAPRVAMTLRLDSERHLKLRLLSAHSHLSSQEILTAALDDYLERQGCEPGLQHCECLQQGVARGKACR